MGQRLIIFEEEKSSILSQYNLITEQQSVFLAAYPNIQVLRAANMNITPNTNIIYLTKRDKDNNVLPNSKFSYKVSGSYGLFDFNVKLRNFKRLSNGSLELEAQPTNNLVLSAMKKLVPKESKTSDDWLRVEVPVDKLNLALQELLKNKGSVANINAGEGVEIELKQVV
jgi:hypothetical protein